ncbi:MAG: carbamate kinase [Bacteroides sp.]|nr:carbamate kinase [Bacteroides sp.]MCM1085022.1 carbamate kinase [Bacteroides sp.]
MKTAVVALGGNALLRSGQKGTFAEQTQNVDETCRALVALMKQGYTICVGHGNGPQVGNVMLQHEAGNKAFGLPAMPMDFCVAETQGSIGYMIEICLQNRLREAGIDKSIMTLLTQVKVDKNDPAFQKPTKPVGPYYKKEEAERFAAETGAQFKEDPKGNGWRKVVPSPTPIDIDHVNIVKDAVNKGNVVITVGGGGIPVIEENGMYKGVEAVIDKDLASALLAAKIGADNLFILTDVSNVYIRFRKPDEQRLERITVAQAKQYLADGEFAEGSMAPKVRAAIFFLEHGGKECVITQASELSKADAGTRIVNE